ncbi:uncharacterized protein CLUP02_08707 [Colletotrichum lupini]|uniref:Uncharacterized protein n=1 Tax=Colletotrichum lupini TaxID=145971 RepID=A0A9Q8WGW1_9PEZI|nr:uncharacterized protein CLUP02_08707 [Colletotrichum lupini]UQC83213.1 hypothetical protein CLUP02_08707 [Colletotrichum lupini]
MHPSLFGHRVTRRRLGNLQNRVIHCFFAARNILPVTNSNEIGQIRCLPWGPFSLFLPYQSHQDGKNGHWFLWFGFPREVGILTNPWPLAPGLLVPHVTSHDVMPARHSGRRTGRPSTRSFRVLCATTKTATRQNLRGGTGGKAGLMGRKSADATGQIDDGQVEAVRYNPMVVSAQPAGSTRSWLGSSHLPSNQNAQMPVFPKVDGQSRVRTRARELKQESIGCHLNDRRHKSVHSPSSRMITLIPRLFCPCQPFSTRSQLAIDQRDHGCMFLARTRSLDGPKVHTPLLASQGRVAPAEKRKANASPSGANVTLHPPPVHPNGYWRRRRRARPPLRGADIWDKLFASRGQKGKSFRVRARGPSHSLAPVSVSPEGTWWLAGVRWTHIYGPSRLLGSTLIASS